MIMNCHSAVFFVATVATVVVVVVAVARFPTALRKNGTASFCHCDNWPYDFSGSTQQVFPGLFLRGERGETLLDTAKYSKYGFMDFGKHLEPRISILQFHIFQSVPKMAFRFFEDSPRHRTFRLGCLLQLGVPS